MLVKTRPRQRGRCGREGGRPGALGPPSCWVAWVDPALLSITLSHPPLPSVLGEVRADWTRSHILESQDTLCHRGSCLQASVVPTVTGVGVRDKRERTLTAPAPGGSLPAACPALRGAAQGSPGPASPRVSSRGQPEPPQGAGGSAAEPEAAERGSSPGCAPRPGAPASGSQVTSVAVDRGPGPGRAGSVGHVEAPAPRDHGPHHVT